MRIFKRRTKQAGGETAPAWMLDQAVFNRVEKKDALLGLYVVYTDTAPSLGLSAGTRGEMPIALLLALCCEAYGVPVYDHGGPLHLYLKEAGMASVRRGSPFLTDQGDFVCPESMRKHLSGIVQNVTSLRRGRHLLHPPHLPHVAAQALQVMRYGSTVGADGVGTARGSLYMALVQAQQILSDAGLELLGKDTVRVDQYRPIQVATPLADTAT